MKSLCLDRLPTGWEAELDRWRTSVHTVGRCFTDCRQRCSPNQNLAREKKDFGVSMKFQLQKLPDSQPILSLTAFPRFTSARLKINSIHNRGNPSQHPSCHLLSQVLLLTAISQFWQARSRRQTLASTVDSELTLLSFACAKIYFTLSAVNIQYLMSIAI